MWWFFSFGRGGNWEDGIKFGHRDNQESRQPLVLCGFLPQCGSDGGRNRESGREPFCGPKGLGPEHGKKSSKAILNAAKYLQSTAKK